ncbi:MAG TPA: hypothetical protein VFT99_14885, partial [Roseiflexaceae bacterium]|nr:hypothetical protein [Roseiflexaceae bacterium]
SRRNAAIAMPGADFVFSSHTFRAPYWRRRLYTTQGHVSRNVPILFYRRTNHLAGHTERIGVQPHNAHSSLTSATAPDTTAISRRSGVNEAWRWAVRLWLGVELLFAGWCAWVSSVYPKWNDEAAVSVWPGSAPLGAWLERVLLLPLLRYDVLWYAGIAQYGYGHRAGDTAFHPLFPALMGVLGRVFGGSYGAYLLAGWIVAQVCTVVMLALFYQLVALDYERDTAQRATLYLLISPLGFAFLIPYTEPLLLMCIVGALLAARQGRWALAGLAGAGAALTKQPGVVVLLPLMWEWWAWRKRQKIGGQSGAPQGWQTLIRPLAGIALTPLGLLAWLVYRATLGDVALTWNNPASIVDALLVTPTYKDVWGETFSWPWVNFGYALEQLQTRPYFYLIINTFLMLIMLVLAVFAVLRMRGSYVIYTVVLVLMNLSIVYPLWPYMGIIRRFTIIFPLFIGLALWGRSRLLHALIVICSSLLWVLIGSMYVRNAFVP